MSFHHEPVELTDTSDMDRARTHGFYPGGQAFEPLLSHDQDEEADSTSGEEEPLQSDSVVVDEEPEPPFSWTTYLLFSVLGIAMLWAWNMFLAGAPYFQRRFETNPWILNHFQPAEISVATVMNLLSMLVLSYMQKNANYPRRIISALVASGMLFTVLAISTFIHSSAQAYFGFLLAVIVISSLCTGFVQNGVFSFTVGFGRNEYTQAIMVGQAIAGVLPPLTQIISVVAVPKRHDTAGAASASSTSAFVYFIAATVVSVVTLAAFFELLRRKALYEASHPDFFKTDGLSRRPSRTSRRLSRSMSGDELAIRKTVPLTRILKKIPYLALAVILCFAITMIFPVFTTATQSVNGIDAAIFIPLAFLIWNMGDLLGRVSTIFPQLLLTHHPFALVCIALARLIFVPLYYICNIKGKGAKVNSDFFYLFVVQFLFGLTNGYLGSSCMIGAGDWVAPDEREAAGGFMALFLVAGLTIGSLLSFALGDI